MKEQEQIKRVAGKLQELLRHHDLLIKENTRLKASVAQLQKQQDEQVSKIASLEQSVSVLRTLQGKLDEPDRKLLEKQLNAYIREIDRCIAMLGE